MPGNIHFIYAGEDSVLDYKRWLDLETGISGVQYTAHQIIV